MPPPTRLQREHRRLFMAPAPGEGEAPVAGGLLGADGRVRALVIQLGRPADWTALAPVWQGVQADWGWPAPAIAINGSDAFELWFSVQEPLAREQAAGLVNALCQRYLSAVKPGRWQAWPDAQGDVLLPELPPRAVAPDRWAAFVAADLPAVFQDDPSLDFAPGADAQAELLATLRSVSPAQVSEALEAMATEIMSGGSTEPAAPAACTRGAPPSAPVAVGVAPSLMGPFADPSAFLRAVMNEPTAPLGLRVDAAKALLGAGT